MTTPTRRQTLKTAAWSIPAVTVAGATPAFASSTGISPTPTGALKIGTTRSGEPAFTGSRVVVPGGSSYVRIDNLSAYNSGPDALPAGALVVSVTIPPEWGTVTGLRSGWTFDSARLAFSADGQTAHFTVLPGFGSLIPSGDIDIASTSSGVSHLALAFNTSLHELGNNLPITASVSTVSTTAPNNFTGNTITATTSTSVWSW